MSDSSGRSVLEKSDLRFLDEEMMELSLLLPSVQARALLAAAHGRGLTVGQMIRRLIHDFTQRGE
jgi:hypothetical protein